MTVELITALCAFAFVASVTPGPNNLMLMASGANFGVRRTLPHFAGVVLGFLLMVLLVGAGLTRIFEAYPLSHDILKACSIVYLSWLAWKIAASRPGQGPARGRPLTALQAAMFQWVNPKAWALALTALTVYAPSQGYASVLLVALLCALVNTPSVFVWVILGSRLRVLLQDPRRLRVFNYLMALLLLATLYPVLAA